jgi:hypothetical protein
MCLDFHCSICDSVRCDSEVAFRVISYIFSLGFLSEPTKLVGVTGSQTLQKQKHCQVLTTCLLFANVAKKEIW